MKLRRLCIWDGVLSTLSISRPSEMGHSYFWLLLFLVTALWRVENQSKSLWRLHCKAQHSLLLNWQQTRDVCQHWNKIAIWEKFSVIAKGQITCVTGWDHSNIKKLQLKRRFEKGVIRPALLWRLISPRPSYRSRKSTKGLCHTTPHQKKKSISNLKQNHFWLTGFRTHYFLLCSLLTFQHFLLCTMNPNSHFIMLLDQSI